MKYIFRIETEKGFLKTALPILGGIIIGLLTVFIL